MSTADELQLRRDVRAAVFRTARLRRAGREIEADEQLAAELAAAQARLATAGDADPAAVLHRWQMEDDAALAIAQLIGELVLEGLAAAPGHPAAPAREPAASVSPTPVASPLLAFPAPPTGGPGLADLLDEMLLQDRPRRPHPF